MNRQSINTGLTIAQRKGIRQLLDTLLDYDEPEALMSALQRIAERKAYSVTHGRIDVEAAARWLALAEALAKVGAELPFITVPLSDPAALPQPKRATSNSRRSRRS